MNFPLTWRIFSGGDRAWMLEVRPCDASGACILATSIESAFRLVPAGAPVELVIRQRALVVL